MHQPVPQVHVCILVFTRRMMLAMYSTWRARPLVLVSSTKFTSCGGKRMHGTTSRHVTLSWLCRNPLFCVAAVLAVFLIRLNDGQPWRVGAPR